MAATTEVTEHDLIPEKVSGDAGKQAIEQHLMQGRSWDSSRIAMIEKSERRAWMVAIVLGCTTLLAWLSIALMMPLKRTEPYVVRVDSVTGVPDIITMMKDQVVSTDDVMNKHFMARYVIARETYDWYTLQSDYDLVGTFSNAEVGAEYAQLFNGDNALDKKYQDKVKATVEIVSVVPQGGNTGQVRFIKRTDRHKTGQPPVIKKWIATISFEYRNTHRLPESQRLINPFGFQVRSYRVDPELE